MINLCDFVYIHLTKDRKVPLRRAQCLGWAAQWVSALLRVLTACSDEVTQLSETVIEI